MRRFVAIPRLVLVLQLVSAQITPTTEQAGPRVLTFMELFKKSTCQPMEQFVDVAQEFPEEPEYIFLPSCVPLLRCSGCCQDEGFECQPTLKRNVTIELLKIRPNTNNNKLVNRTFVEHQKCECRARQERKNENSTNFQHTTKFRRNISRRANG